MRFCDIHQNFPFHVSFQGKKDFENRSMGYGVISYFVQLLQFCSSPALYEKTWKNGEISKNAKLDDAILLTTPLFLNRFSKIFFPPKADMLSFQGEKEFLKLVHKQTSYDRKTIGLEQNWSTCT